MGRGDRSSANKSLRSWSAHSGLQRTGRTRNKYSLKEDYAIIEFIVDNHESFSSSPNFWKEMTAVVPRHSWLSLKNRFLRSIVANLKNFKLPKSSRKIINNIVSTWELRSDQKCAFSSAEDNFILDFVKKMVDRNCCYIWKELAKEKIVEGHSTYDLRNRYEYLIESPGSVNQREGNTVSHGSRGEASSETELKTSRSAKTSTVLNDIKSKEVSSQRNVEHTEVDSSSANDSDDQKSQVQKPYDHSSDSRSRTDVSLNKVETKMGKCKKPLNSNEKLNSVSLRNIPIHKRMQPTEDACTTKSQISFKRSKKERTSHSEVNVENSLPSESLRVEKETQGSVDLFSSQATLHEDEQISWVPWSSCAVQDILLKDSDSEDGSLAPYKRISSRLQQNPFKNLNECVSKHQNCSQSTSETTKLDLEVNEKDIGDSVRGQALNSSKVGSVCFSMETDIIDPDILLPNNSEAESINVVGPMSSKTTPEEFPCGQQLVESSSPIDGINFDNNSSVQIVDALVSSCSLNLSSKRTLMSQPAANPKEMTNVKQMKKLFDGGDICCDSDSNYMIESNICVVNTASDEACMEGKHFRPNTRSTRDVGTQTAPVKIRNVSTTRREMCTSPIKFFESNKKRGIRIKVKSDLFLKGSFIGNKISVAQPFSKGNKLQQNSAPNVENDISKVSVSQEDFTSSPAVSEEALGTFSEEKSSNIKAISAFSFEVVALSVKGLIAPKRCGTTSRASPKTGSTFAEKISPTSSPKSPRISSPKTEAPSSSPLSPVCGNITQFVSGSCNFPLQSQWYSHI